MYFTSSNIRTINADKSIDLLITNGSGACLQSMIGKLVLESIWLAIDSCTCGLIEMN